MREFETTSDVPPPVSAERKSANAGPAVPDELQSRIEEAQRLEAFGLLACGLVHDFNNALTIILGQADLVRDMDPKDETAARRLESVLQAGKTAANLARGLVEIAHATDDVRHPVNVASLAKEGAKILEAAYGHRLRFDSRIEKRPCYVRIAPAAFHQILMNLVINAVQASPPGGCVTIELVAEPASEADKTGRAVLEVRDQGVGVPEAIRDEIFNPFFTTKADGSGLGLSTVAGIVDGCGGELRLEETRRGASFRVTLPLDASAAAEEKTEQEPATGRLDATIVLADRNPDVGQVLAEGLARSGARAEHVRSVPDLFCRLKLSASPVDMVLVDETMGRGAHVVAEQIRRRWPWVLVVAVTSERTSAAVERALRTGMIHGILQKPFVTTPVVPALRTILARHKRIGRG